VLRRGVVSTAGQADTGLMPKRMRDLSSFGSFFDPRGVWHAEQAKVLQAEEDEKKRSEEDEKRRQVRAPVLCYAPITL
jgi:hypothetical protein